MPIDGETCVNCGHRIRHIVVWDRTSGGEDHPGEGWKCGPDCNAPTGPSDLEQQP